MLFNSINFLIFFPVVVAIYFLLPHRIRWLWLLGMSCVFYMAFVPVYIFILGFTIVIDYFAGILIEKFTGKPRKLMLLVSLCANIGVLAVFKYYNFITENINQIFSSFRYPNEIPLLDMLLPIGLSFHTFQAMSYIIEVYRGNQNAEKHFGIYALYVMFFPQLVAGPIERPQNLLPQFKEKKYFEADNVLSGLQQMLWGFFKKVVIADRLALYVDSVFINHTEYGALNLSIAALFFTLQIYADFSGYSDIALGTARILGFNLMVNFDRPLISKSITEFWRRWHISLSSWFNDYLFQPLMISTRNWAMAGAGFSLLFTFFLAGLWHGAGWTFIIYGIIHGSALTYEFYTRKWRKRWSKKINASVYNSVSILLTFCFVSMALIFFRAPSVEIAFEIIVQIFHSTKAIIFSWQVGSGELTFNAFSWLVIIISLPILFIAEKYMDVKTFHPANFKNCNVYFGILLLTLILTCGIFNQTSFIYFQF